MCCVLIDIHVLLFHFFTLSLSPQEYFLTLVPSLFSFYLVLLVAPGPAAINLLMMQQHTYFICSHAFSLDLSHTFFYLSHAHSQQSHSRSHDYRFLQFIFSLSLSHAHRTHTTLTFFTCVCVRSFHFFTILCVCVCVLPLLII